MEIAVGALIGIVIQRLVHPVKIKRQRDRLANLGVGKQRASHVEGHPAGILRRLVGFVLFDYIVAGEIATLVLGCPVFWRAFNAEVIGTGLKGFQRNFIVQVVVVADAVEVKTATVNRQVSRPIISHALIGNILA